MSDIRKGNRFSPSLCVTHNCNLNCVYCYQKHDTNNRMSFDIAKKSIDWIFSNVPEDMDGVEVSFIGGEPLLEYDLIRKIYDYTNEKYGNEYSYIFYATTNGVLLDEKMKSWFYDHKDTFVLGLSLDGLPDTHNHNRSNSFDKIDNEFFQKTWPFQGIKMTISDYTLPHLADDLIYLHELGFKEIGGLNLFEGKFDWSDERYIRLLIPELKKLVAFYVEHDDLMLDQMMGRRIDVCCTEFDVKRKWCGIGTGTIFFDTDGKRYPCPFVTPMTFSSDELEDIQNTDFNNNDNFVDEECFDCYIHPICPYCPGANYLTQKSFKHRDKSKCRVQKLITLYVADLLAKRLLKNPESVPKEQVYNTITAIERIRKDFLSEFNEYADIM